MHGVGLHYSSHSIKDHSGNASEPQEEAAIQGTCPAAVVYATRQMKAPPITSKMILMKFLESKFDSTVAAKVESLFTTILLLLFFSLPFLYTVPEKFFFILTTLYTPTPSRR